MVGSDAVTELLTGGSGDDLIDGAGGRDVTYAGAGNDTLHGDDGNDWLDGGAGNDIIEGGQGNDFLYGGAGDDALRGGIGNDQLVDDLSGNDSFYGEDGNDNLDIGRDSDAAVDTLFLSGGDGNDKITVNVFNASNVTVDAGGGNDALQLFATTGDRTVTLGSGADVVTLTTFTTSSTIHTTRITDFETGDSGDRLDFGGFLSRLVGWDKVSNPFAGGFVRLVQSGSDALLQYDVNGPTGGASWVTIVTFEDADATAFTPYNLSGYSAAGTVPDGVTVAGTSGDDWLHGNYGTDLIGGQEGNDLLYGLGGDDQLEGGLGNDQLYGDTGNDHLLGGDDNDFLNGGAGNDLLEGGEGVDTFTAGAGDDAIFGGGGNDSIFVGDLGNDSIHGDDGDDSIRLVLASNAAEHVFITGDAGNDTISVSVHAGTSVDVDGGTGDDRVILLGGAANQVTLGDGRDVVELGSGFTAGGANVVTDFQGGDTGDTIDFSRWLADYSATLDPNANPFLTGTMRIAQSGTDVLLQFDQDGSGTAYDWSTLLTLQNVDLAALRPANFDNYQLLFQHGTGNGDTLDGGSFDDILYGEGGDDIIHGFGGADTLFGGEGSDTIDGGSGADTISGDAADDAITGGGDADTISGGDGNDTIDGGTETDILHGDAGNDGLAGSDGNDQLYGDAGNDTLTGGADNDYLNGGTGDDVMDGGEGDDSFDSASYDGTPQHDQVAGGTGTDDLLVEFFDIINAPGLTMTIALDSSGYSGAIASGTDYGIAFTGIEAFAIAGTDNADQITTGDFDDLLIGRGGADILSGAGGNDWLIGGGGADVMTGGTGNDRFEVDDANDAVIENAGEGTDLVDSALASYTLSANLENLNGLLSTGQSLTGNASANVIKAGSGNDVLDGGAGADNMSGGSGNDIYYVDDAGDVVTESGGIDEIRTSLATFSIATLSAIENLTGIVDSGQVLTGNGFGNVIRGGDGDDQLNGGGGIDTIYGGGGNDQLNGGTSGDTMRGELGDDVYVVDSSLDAVIENAGEGIDKVTTSLAAYTLATDVENLTGTSGAAQNLRGNTLDNVVTGAAAGDTIRLQDGGADKAFGNGGNDVLYFGAALTAADEADGGAGTDTLALQGDYSAGVTFGANGLVGIETLQLLTRTDARYGGSGTTPNIYRVALVDANVAAAASLTVDASGLSSNEAFSFNGAAESDGHFAIMGGRSADSLVGGALADTINGGTGNDFVDGGAGADTMAGGTGDDIYVVDNSGDVVTENAGDGTDEVRTALASYTLAANAENLTGLSSSGQDLMDNALSNVITGGSGNDKLYDETGATGILRGNDGDDYLYFRRYVGTSWTSGTIEGGEGNDSVAFGSFTSGSATVDTGAGDDKIFLEKVTGSLLITLGSGHDAIYAAGLMDGLSGNVVVTDFQAGAGGDSIDWASAFPFAFGAHGYTEGSNPFAQGYARLIQSGADTLLQISRAADGNFTTILTFLNHAPSDFTADNLGWPPAPTQVTDASPSGTSGDDWLVGSSGTIFYDLSQGGNDFAQGGTGVDVFYFAAALTAADGFDGGAGKDIAVLQGDYSGGVTLGTAALANVETLSILGHSDNRFGGGGASPYSYDLTSADGNVAAGQQLVVNASTLEAGENFAFDGSAETDGSFFIYGGKGVDDLKGGSGVDVFFFAEQGRFGASDQVDGGGGNDILVLRGDYTIDMASSAVTNVETVTLMSGSDSRFFSTLSSFNYDITTVEDTVAAGATMTFNGGGLKPSETLIFDGSAEHDGAFRLFGGAGADTIAAGSGADLLFGGLGADTLRGGAGNDIFRYQAAAESTSTSLDRILDFASGDRIDLSRIDAKSGIAGDQAFTFVGAFSHHAGELIATNGGSGNVWTVSGDVDGDGAADFQIMVTVADGHAIGASDFLP